MLGDTEIHAILSEVDQKLPEDIARLLREEQPKDIYAAVVSSQFDADRLDYLRRDRLMTGVECAHLDIGWIFDCLEVGTVTLGNPADPVEEPCLYLSPKGGQVAEEYLEARFRLYMMVYMHKTTRGAEMIIQELLARLREFATKDPELRKWSRLASFVAAEEATLSNYLHLDDAVVWAELVALSELSNPVGELAARLINRRLYKCFDLGAAVGERDTGNRRLRFIRAVRERSADFPGLLIDDADVAGYKWYDYESTSALEKVLVKRERDDAEPRDIAEVSEVVRTLIARANIHRLYVPTREQAQRLNQIFREVPQ